MHGQQRVTSDRDGGEARRSVTGYKKFDPAVAGGVEEEPYWMVGLNGSGGELLGSVRFKEEFKRRTTLRQAVTTESSSCLPIQ